MSVKLDRKKGQVFLHTYSLFPITKYIACLGIGLYHTGIEVYGREYMFTASVGICTCKPMGAYDCEYLSTIYLGTTKLTRKGLREMIRKLKREDFNLKNYHVTDNNCNNFSECKLEVKLLLIRGKIDFGNLLVENDDESNFPSYLNRISKIGSHFKWVVPDKYLKGDFTNSTINPQFEKKGEEEENEKEKLYSEKDRLLKGKERS